MYEEAISLIEKYDRIVIHRHQNPDGDAIGSAVGLKHLILDNYPGKQVYTVGDAPGRYAFMDDSTPDDVSDGFYSGTLAIILDTGTAHLISDDRYTLADDTLRFDHHIFCGKIARVEVIDTTFESCCGLITDLALTAGWNIGKTAAKSLFTGMVTDSGRFRYDSTSSHTFSLASHLTETGFDASDIYRNLYADDFSNIRARAGFIMRVQFTDCNVAYIYTTLDEAEKTGMSTFAISRGMVGVMSDVRGVDIWVNFTETADGVLAEIRSSKYNINPVAVKYGGGGHAKASGATLPSRDQATAMLADLDAIIKENAV